MTDRIPELAKAIQLKAREFGPAFQEVGFRTWVEERLNAFAAELVAEFSGCKPHGMLNCHICLTLAKEGFLLVEDNDGNWKRVPIKTVPGVREGSHDREGDVHADPKGL